MIQRMDNVAIVVDDLAGAIAFFVELGLELEGEATVEGPMGGPPRRPRGCPKRHRDVTDPGRPRPVELSKFQTPAAVSAEPNAPVNRLGMGRIMFAVDDIDAVVAGLQARGSELVGEVVQYEDSYRLCYVRGPEGIVIALAEKLS